MIMYHFTAFTILGSLVVCAVASLISPCPKIFIYEGEPENDRWYGVLTFFSNVELVGLAYKIQLDRPGHLLISWDGEVRSEDNVNFNVFDPNHIQRAREVVKSRIMVKFDPSISPPNVVKIIINGNTVCTGDSNGPPLTPSAATDQPGRPDPFSVDEDVVIPEYGNRPSNQNTNPPPEKVRPSYYETPGYNGGIVGANYNSNSGSGTSYLESGQTYPQNVGYQQSNSPHYPSNNKNTNGNPTYSSSQSYTPAENVIYPSNHNSNSQSQWPTENLQNSFNSNRNNTGPIVNNGPLVTTLTLPNNTQNKNNVETIIQIIKNQLEQQQGTSNSNNTVIVALVSPVNTNQQAAGAHQAVSNISQNRDSLTETTHRTTSASTQSSVGVSKVRSTTSQTTATKTSNNIRNNKD